ncbi:hypothetical protein V6Z11_D04G090100 [Gossypium hirsutum]
MLTADCCSLIAGKFTLSWFSSSESAIPSPGPCASEGSSSPTPSTLSSSRVVP